MNEQAEAFCVVGGADCYAECRAVFLSVSPCCVMDLGGDVRPHVICTRHKERVSDLHFCEWILGEWFGLFNFQNFELHGALVKC